MLKTLAVVGTVALLAGCNSTPKATTGDSAPQPSEPASTRQPGPVTIQRFDGSLESYYKYSSGYGDSVRLVIRDNDAWSGVWSRIVSNHGPTPALPTIDFAKEMLIVAALGTRATGGYSIAVTAVEEHADGIAVTVLRTSPGRTCGTTAALTAPVDIVRVRRSDLPVRFIEQSAVHDCG